MRLRQCSARSARAAVAAAAATGVQRERVPAVTTARLSMEFGSWTDEEVATRLKAIMASMDASGKGDTFREGHPWHMAGYESHVAIGQATPDPTVYNLGGKPAPLSSFVGDTPTVLNLGSYT